ncbi:hypothetical protein CMV_019152 [Castanea mollissima]|uniref:Uncharacterized protein n=1 Tax=Castanea mollissima TaxID=60419 RepID=A0A8J4R3J2_9ROSI|nr:hypothetical protein CMV_019152 [Castanea mollissima]
MQSSNSGMEFGPRLHAPFDFGYYQIDHAVTTIISRYLVVPPARMCSETSEKSWLLSLIATGHSFHLSHTSLANLHLKIAWGMDSVSDSHKGQALIRRIGVLKIQGIDTIIPYTSSPFIYHCIFQHTIVYTIVYESKENRGNFSSCET